MFVFVEGLILMYMIKCSYEDGVGGVLLEFVIVDIICDKESFNFVVKIDKLVFVMCIFDELLDVIC